VSETKEAEIDDGDVGYGVAPEPQRVIWTMKYQDGREEEQFEDRLALAALLMGDAVFLNDHWWKEEWPDEARRITSINVNCNDVFAWGCADSEEMPYKELRDVYDHYIKDSVWGPAIWCMKQRKEMPQGSVEKSIRKTGTWDLDEIQKTYGLRVNHYDGISMVLAQRKYSVYCEWIIGCGEAPLPFDGRWWSGWKDYTEAHPEWRSEEWKSCDEAAITKWRTQNGWTSP